MLADRAIVRSLGWVQRRLLVTEFSSVSSGSSDLGMHFVAPTMIRHCSTQEKGGRILRGEKHQRKAVISQDTIGRFKLNT